MSKIPENLKYTTTHEWVRKEEDGSVTIGVTDHAQCMLGDLVFVELPEDDIELESGQECSVLESVKAAADIYSPISGVVTEVNEGLNSTPEVVNQSPYDGGWLFKLMPVSEKEFDKLLDAKAYEACVKAEAH
jgi:glycine cleavage system H protein